jgi:hypothetical protein
MQLRNRKSAGGISGDGSKSAIKKLLVNRQSGITITLSYTLDILKVFSTYKILKSKLLNRDVDEEWVDWALEMMEAGYKSVNLHILAGITRPYNQFELRNLTENVLRDLNLDYSNEDKVFRDYAHFLIETLLGDPKLI